MEDNLRTFDSHRPLSEAERAALFDIAEGMKNSVPCTACRYCCAGCPAGLDIPFLIECYNWYKGDSALTASTRLDGLDENRRPAACVGCGQCAHVCPQSIDVPGVMTELAKLYAEGPKWADMSRGRQDSIRRDLNMK